MSDGEIVGQIRGQPGRPPANPHAERLGAEEITELVRGHHGIKTIVFDKDIAEAVLAYNTATGG